MARPYVFTCDTTLYHPSEGARVFPAGETDPGAAWTEKRGGEPADKGTTKQALKDLIAAQDQIDALGEQLNGRDRDMAVLAQERDEANNKVADLEQRAIAAEGLQKAAEEATRGYIAERDQARQEVDELKAKIEGLKADAERVPALVAELSAAEQRAADLSGRVQEMETDIANLTAPDKGAKSEKAGK